MLLIRIKIIGRRGGSFRLGLFAKRKEDMLMWRGRGGAVSGLCMQIIWGIDLANKKGVANAEEITVQAHCCPGW